MRVSVESKSSKLTVHQQKPIECEVAATTADDQEVPEDYWTELRSVGLPRAAPEETLTFSMHTAQHAAPAGKLPAGCDSFKPSTGLP